MSPVLKINQRHCLLTLISSAIVVLCVIIAVTMNLTTLYDVNFDHMGLKTFCMFTVNSNILMAAGMSMVFPYTIDGLRKKNFHLPNWVIDFIYMGVTTVALTFLVSLFVLSPVKGFKLIFSGSRFFLHGVCPILSIIAFGFFIIDHQITIRDSFLPLIPVFLYSAVYYVEVVVIGVNRGGWNDFYGFATRVPVWIPMLLILPITYGIATLLRLLHNHERRQTIEREAAIFRESYAGANVRELVTDLAREYRLTVKVRDILIPARIISYLLAYSEDDCTLEECCKLFVDVCFKTYKDTHAENGNGGKSAAGSN